MGPLTEMFTHSLPVWSRTAGTLLARIPLNSPFRHGLISHWTDLQYNRVRVFIVALIGIILGDVIIYWDAIVVFLLFHVDSFPVCTFPVPDPVVEPQERTAQLLPISLLLAVFSSAAQTATNTPQCKVHPPYGTQSPVVCQNPSIPPPFSQSPSPLRSFAIHGWLGGAQQTLEINSSHLARAPIAQERVKSSSRHRSCQIW